MEEIIATVQKSEASRVEELIPFYLRSHTEAFQKFLEHYYNFMTQNGGVDSFTIIGRGDGYESESGIATSGGSGIGLTVDIIAKDNGTISSAVVARPGFGYRVGDLIYINNESVPNIRFDPSHNLDPDVNEDYGLGSVSAFRVIELVDNPTAVINQMLLQHDLDYAKDEYLDNIGAEIARGIPEAPKIDRRTLLKNITKYYRNRGSWDSIQTFFKVFFDEDAVVTNDVKPWTYRIKIGISKDVWGDNYNYLIHPAGMQYIVDMLIEIFADNDFDAGNIVLGILESGEQLDTINFKDPLWLKNLIVNAGSHTPTDQIGWLRQLVNIWVAATVNHKIVSPMPAVDRIYTHQNGLIISALDPNVIGNARKTEIINVPVYRGQQMAAGRYLNEGLLYLFREPDWIDKETGSQPGSLRQGPELWSGYYYISIDSDCPLIVADRYKIPKNDKTFIPMLLDNEMVTIRSADNSGVQTIESIKDVEVRRRSAEYTDESKHYYSSYNRYGFCLATILPPEVEAFSVTASVFLSGQPFQDDWTITDLDIIGPLDPTTIKEKYIGRKLENFRLPGGTDSDPQYLIQIPYDVVEAVPQLYAVIYFSGDIDDGLIESRILIGPEFQSGEGLTITSEAFSLEHIEDLREFKSHNEYARETISGETPTYGDGTARFSFSTVNDIIVKEDVLFKLSDQNTIAVSNTFFDPADKRYVSPRLISWKSTFIELTGMMGLNDDDIYSVADFGETAPLSERGLLIAWVDDQHGNTLHYDGSAVTGIL